MSNVRRSFYPLPPSLYPRPILDPAPAYETSYGAEFGGAAARTTNQLYFRSRTFNDYTPVDPALKPNMQRDIYPKHGEASYNLPYYRRDSKGFRVQYSQPTYVDDHYLRKTAWKKEQALRQSLNMWAHPSSVPNYRDGPLRSRPNTVPASSSQQQADPQFTAELERRRVMEAEERKQRNAILNDPLLVDPLANAYRKPRTTYKRAFGHCR
jgi:hypothetical protein